mmetsp:Transcript_8474/g.15291  ORF Transcript_8474/g.15291 Transcript_8474/m.15291 type:complete len:397 (+) Transcript_8474:63-1253(+)|eukprot:CAMPEP_0205907844 /NCGR_PEP_ID=MMETSP1325-20131115/2810_1 /ASSEMBLY_ACC=CAM_ASM_000708 /TAXON_ID=236786 /ORGANISM="Florenciella sp., Strain RCC1007" /LENGTH=396 /DNA_ID=CAMNT_0053273989 /DNA_START=63 /DNA_END=1253 /DNA_ORIENTATION=+
MLGRTICVALALGVASAFTPSRWVPTRSAVTMGAAAPTMSKFERLQARWKGEPRSVDESKAGFGYDAFEAGLGDTSCAFARGDVIQGKVVQYEYQGALVDIGAKSAAFMPLREAALIPDGDVATAVAIDETRDFQIISDEDENGQLLVSIRRLEFQNAWDKVLASQVEDKAFDGEVIGVNRGGAIVNVHGLRAFLPGSHLCGAVPSEDIIGQTFRLKFLEVNQETNKLVVSNRRAVVEDQMRELSRGDVVQGVVKAIKPYGAFVEIAGMSGLLHISQISYDRIEDLSSVVELNSLIKCMIIDHDKVNGRIALSTKTLEPEPGDMLKDPKMVFEKAEETAAKYHERMEAERRAREEAAKDIVMGLGEDLETPFSASSDLEQILSSEPAAEAETPTEE